MRINIFRRLKKRCGFTLVELLTVMMIIGALATIAVPSYKRYQIKARESVLAEDLYQMRRAIDAYYADYATYPDSLEALVNGRYLRSIPRDPFTRLTNTWKCVPPQYNQQGNLVSGNCFDVISGSKQIGLNGLPYFQW
ncbi:MAG: general secretion pathway protein GspG [Desulfuromonas sp.]|jgi:general secretion pathway protein G|nr:MAG: general secretion pathway protein GspG [Desulfuromonas sp.]